MKKPFSPKPMLLILSSHICSFIKETKLFKTILCISLDLMVHIDRDKNTIADMLSRDSRFKDYISYKDATEKDREWIKAIKLRDDVKEHNGILYLLDEATETKRLILVDKQITSFR
ncbi:hypothetical protein ACTA71_005089 [Dictyostelium dimigraforme]